MAEDPEVAGAGGAAAGEVEAGLAEFLDEFEIGVGGGGEVDLGDQVLEFSDFVG